MIIAILGYIFSSCTFYDPEMSEAGRYPIKQKLPNMDFDWYAGDDVSSTNVDVIKDIVLNEINKNIVTHSGQKSGRLEKSLPPDLHELSQLLSPSAPHS